MEGLDKGGQGPISGCCAIEEEEESIRVNIIIFIVTIYFDHFWQSFGSTNKEFCY
jgi:hypothetical protein